MQKPVRLSLAQNASFNVLAQIFTSLITFVCIPFIVKGLGIESFGLLSILWMFIGYFNLMDLGIGQGATKFFAESLLSNRKEETARLLGAVIQLSLVVGIVGGTTVLLIAFSGLAPSLLKVDPSFELSLKQSLIVLACGVPVVLFQATLRSVPMAFSRFDVANGMQVVGSIVQWVGGAIAAGMGKGVTWLIGLTIISRLIVATGYAFFAAKTIPEFSKTFMFVMKKPQANLLKFGGWVSISQIIAPILTLVERLVIGATLSVAAVAYFAVPSDAVIRLLIIPSSLASALFPYMSGAWSMEASRTTMKAVYLRSIKLTFLVMLVPSMFLCIVSDYLLRLWLGVEFAEHSSIVLSIVAIGIFFNALSQLPSMALQALGRPDIPAKCSLVQLPTYSLLLLVLTPMFGIAGAAIAWTLRVVVEMFYLLLTSLSKMSLLDDLSRYRYVGKATLAILLSSAFLLVARFGLGNPYVVLLVAVIAGGTYGLFVWNRVLLSSEQDTLTGLWKALRGNTVRNPSA